MEIANPGRPAQREPVEALVETGATYSFIPRAVLVKLGLEPAETAEFETADGRTIRREICEAVFHWKGRFGTSKVIFGEDSDSPLLGVIVLESMALQVDPVSRELRPAKLILY
jgi:clan AA aspartic protease